MPKTIRNNYSFANKLLRWAEEFGRHDLPWQHPRDPYRIWISEVMLQQTQVDTAIPYFQRFIDSFPNLELLAESDLDEVLTVWSGLGYYARAKNLLVSARLCKKLYDGRLPNDLDSLLALPGIGRSTAGAIMSLGFDKRYPILDGNVKRVLSRYHAVDGNPGSANTLRALWRLSEKETPRKNIAAYTQAIMDLGASICRPRNPTCQACPVKQQCRAYNTKQIASYPQRRKARKRELREVWFFWATQGSKILLERRKDHTVWHGLFCLPEFPTGKRPELCCQEWFGLVPNDLYRLSSFSHDFTHFRLNGHIWTCKNPERIKIADIGRVLKWIEFNNEADMENTALPSPIRSLLKARHLRLE